MSSCGQQLAHLCMLLGSTTLWLHVRLSLTIVQEARADRPTSSFGCTVPLMQQSAGTLRRLLSACRRCYVLGRRAKVPAPSAVCQQARNGAPNSSGPDASRLPCTTQGLLQQDEARPMPVNKMSLLLLLHLHSSDLLVGEQRGSAIPDLERC